MNSAELTTKDGFSADITYGSYNHALRICLLTCSWGASSFPSGKFLAYDSSRYIITIIQSNLAHVHCELPDVRTILTKSVVISLEI